MNHLQYNDGMTSRELSRFQAQLAREEKAMTDAGPMWSDHRVDGTLAHFNRYIAGDR